jgi:hypothetical protein
MKLHGVGLDVGHVVQHCAKHPITNIGMQCCLCVCVLNPLQAVPEYEAYTLPLCVIAAAGAAAAGRVGGPYGCTQICGRVWRWGYMWHRPVSSRRGGCCNMETTLVQTEMCRIHPDLIQLKKRRKCVPKQSDFHSCLQTAQTFGSIEVCCGQGRGK